MPNWAECSMSVVLPTDNADKFEDLFLSWKGEENKDKKRYFARCFMNYSERESNDNGLTRLFVEFDAAWSLHSCMINGYPNDEEMCCPTLESICKELKVNRLVAFSRESGLVFEESLTYDKDSGLNEMCREMYPDPLADYLDPDEKQSNFAEEMG